MRSSILVLLSAALIGVLPRAAATAPKTLTTQVNVEIGFPQKAAVAGERVEISPGTVLALSQPGATPNPGQRKAVVARMLAYQKLRDRLISTFRLDYARQTGMCQFVSLAPGETTTIPIPVKTDITIDVHQVSAGADLASYTVLFWQSGKLLARTPVSVVPGSRAVVGAMDGPAAPYIFVVLQPILTGGPTPVRFTGNKSVTEPRLIKRVAPVYPEDARKEKVTGIVVLETVIGSDGTIQNVTPLKSPDKRLTKAAEDAVLHWKFEPARDKEGHAVSIIYVLTVRFLLQ